MLGDETLYRPSENFVLGAEYCSGDHFSLIKHDFGSVSGSLSEGWVCAKTAPGSIPVVIPSVEESVTSRPGSANHHDSTAAFLENETQLDLTPRQAPDIDIPQPYLSVELLEIMEISSRLPHIDLLTRIRSWGGE